MKQKARKTEPKNLNEKFEMMMKEFLTKFAEAAYQVALRLGFRGTLITFLSDLEEALHEVIRKDKSTSHLGRKSESHERPAIH